MHRSSFILVIPGVVLLTLTWRVEAAPAPAPAGVGVQWVDLDARTADAGGEVWTNAGALGDFRRIGKPRKVKLDGVAAVQFTGRDAFEGPPSVEAIQGEGARSVEIWARNDTLASEESMISWGKRGANNQDFSFNFGASPDFGAATHWAADLGWQFLPSTGAWHQLVYTYDGTTARVYLDTALANRREVKLATAPGMSILVGAQHGADGALQFRNEFNGEPIGASLYIARVRVWSGVLSPQRIAADFAAEAAHFGAQAAVDPLTAASVTLHGGGLQLKVLDEGGIVASLMPDSGTIDFTPGDRLRARLAPGNFHLGDFTLRWRVGDGRWRDASSAVWRPAAAALVRDGAEQVHWDMSAALGDASPLRVTRAWRGGAGGLRLEFIISNPGQQEVEIGSFGAAMVFNNLFRGRNLIETHTRCSFTDPCPGGNAGYVQVTRVNGAGPALLVLPEKGTGLEAWRPLDEDPTPRGVDFEGFDEWMVHSRAWAEQEWKGVEEWNTPTSRTLMPGETVTYGFRFALAPSIEEIEPTLVSLGQPVAIGVPGYVLPADETGRLFLRAPNDVASIAAEPADAMRIVNTPATPGGWMAYDLFPERTGRCRLVVQYADGTRQFIQYNLIPPQRVQVERLANFHETRQWFDRPDRFGRTHSYLSYDRTANSMILSEGRSYISGLSDEAGAGPNLLMAMKNLYDPDPKQIAHLEQYVNDVLWGHLQSKKDYGIRASLFYGTGWNEARSMTTWRAYNYPHQAAIYWALYRLARDHVGLVKTHPAQWYLSQAAHTALAMKDHCGPQNFLNLDQYGLMVGSVYVEILKDLRRERMNESGDALEAFMRGRADHWRATPYPFGSEMPWDSTGQEEIYAWCRYFGFENKARETLDAITGYMPAIANWGYNGAARRYFDSLVYGKWSLLARELDHYGASLNAIPMLAAWRAEPADLYKLRVGYAGAMGVLANVDEEGFGSMCFIAAPSKMSWEPYSSDYGQAFYGYAREAGACVVEDPVLGWLGFGCNLAVEGSSVSITPRDAFGRQVCLASLALRLTLDAGRIESLRMNLADDTVDLTFAPPTAATPVARLRLEPLGVVGPKSLSAAAPLAPTTPLRTERGAYVIDLATTRFIHLQRK